MLRISATSTNAFSAVILVQRNYWTSATTVTSHCVLSNIIFRKCDRRVLWMKQCSSSPALHLLGTSFLYHKQRMKCPNLSSLASVYTTCPYSCALYIRSTLYIRPKKLKAKSVQILALPSLLYSNKI